MATKTILIEKILTAFRSLYDGNYGIAASIDSVGLDPMCVENSIGERITCTLANTNYASSPVPVGTIAVEVNAPSSADVLVNINANAVINAAALSMRGRWVRAGSTYRYSIKPVDIGHTLRFLTETATGLTVDITFISQ